MRRSLLFLAYCACSFPQPKLDEGNQPDGGAGGTDGAPVDASPCGATFVDACGVAPTEDLNVTANVGISTDTDVRCRTIRQTGGPDVCLLAFRDVQIASNVTLFAHGSRPLALVARRSMTINGTVSVSSSRDRSSTTGAGSVPNGTGVCNAGSPAIPSEGGGGGGAGGSFRSSGGGGGRGNTDGVGGGPSSVPGGSPGPAVAAPAFLRGGCQGQNGGAGMSAPGGFGGGGGGAIYLYSPRLLVGSIGRVLAGGAGSRGAEVNDGGGGGGSGGMIAIESKDASISGLLIATGGGGGGGGLGGSDAGEGADGVSTSPALGGALGGTGGNGGNGATTSSGFSGQGHGGGGGGGGGGTGVILFINTSSSIAGTAMPPITTR